MRFPFVFIAALAVATPASACRVGGDDLIFGDVPAPPRAPRYGTIAEVSLTGERPGPDLQIAGGDWRGFPVGVAQVHQVLRGPKLPSILPIYLEVATSCSNFFRGPKQRFVASGYVVGRLVMDDRGAHLLVAERNDSTGAWR